MKNYDDAKILEEIKVKNIATIEPSFEKQSGYEYSLIKSHLDRLEDQIAFLEKYRKEGVFEGKSSLSMLACIYCDSSHFVVKLLCVLCNSSNMSSGSAIAHDECGNIDFSHNYLRSNGELICEKCNKQLKAIGVDYSKIANIYHCSECGSMLPSIEQLFICTNCCRPLSQNEINVSHLSTYATNKHRLEKKLATVSIVKSIYTILTKHQIKSNISATLKGESNLQHRFPLVVYNYKDTPVVVTEIVEIKEDNKDYSGDRSYDSITNFLLTFIAKCSDVKIAHKVLLVIPRLPEKVKNLAEINGIILIEGNSKEDVVYKSSQIITECFFKSRNEEELNNVQ